eukprot:436655_1
MTASRFDYVIVGGGIYGCFIAWLLSKENDNYKIALLEKNTIASGASGGLGQRGVRGNGRHIAELPLMSIAYSLWKDITNELNISDHYKQIGGIKVTENIKTLKLLHNICNKQNKYGVISQPIINKQILKNMEQTISDNVVGGIYCPFDGVASHELITKTIAKTAEQNGVLVKENCTVNKIQKVDKKWEVLTVNKNGTHKIYIATKSLCLFCNGGVKKLLKNALNIPFHQVSEILPQIIVMNKKQLNGTNKINHLIGHFERRLALKTLPNNNLMISGGYLGRYNSKTETCEPKETNVSANIKDTKDTFPTLINNNELCKDNIIAKTDRFESICIDEIPIIDRIGTDDKYDCDLYYGFGWCGHGWAISPAVSKNVVEWIKSKKCPNLLTSFSIKRFVVKKKSKL